MFFSLSLSFSLSLRLKKSLRCKSGHGGDRCQDYDTFHLIKELESMYICISFYACCFRACLHASPPQNILCVLHCQFHAHFFPLFCQLRAPLFCIFFSVFFLSSYYVIFKEKQAAFNSLTNTWTQPLGNSQLMEVSMYSIELFPFMGGISQMFLIIVLS